MKTSLFVVALLALVPAAGGAATPPPKHAHAHSVPTKSPKALASLKHCKKNCKSTDQKVLQP